MQVRLFAGAAEAAGVTTESVGAGLTLAELRTELINRHGPHFAQILHFCTILVDGTCLADSDLIPKEATVDVLPPFAGG